MLILYYLERTSLQGTNRWPHSVPCSEVPLFTGQLIRGCLVLVEPGPLLESEEVQSRVHFFVAHGSTFSTVKPEKVLHLQTGHV